MLYTSEHKALYESVSRFVAEEINPHVDEWEASGMYPAHELFPKLAKQGWLGITRAEKYGGLALDWSYTLAFAEALGETNCGSVPLSVGVQTDMATPALANFGSDELRDEFLRPSIEGRYVACIGVS
jgi:citronellyl-CoA dehydrogenase